MRTKLAPATPEQVIRFARQQVQRYVQAQREHERRAAELVKAGRSRYAL